MQKSGSMILSMDALFGLPRKKSAGRSFREAIHGHLFFGDQSAVDEFVASAPSKHKKGPKVCIHQAENNWNIFIYACFAYIQSCGNFLAGEALRSYSATMLLMRQQCLGVHADMSFPTC